MQGLSLRGSYAQALSAEMDMGVGLVSMWKRQELKIYLEHDNRDDMKNLMLVVSA